MSSFQGLLHSISVMDVVQVLHVNKKTGQLRLQNGRAQGVLHFSGGEVVHAESGRNLGESAAFELMTWDRGEFIFVPEPVKPIGSIRRSVPDLLMESARTLDTRRRLRSYFPTLEAVPWTFLPEPALTSGLDLVAEARMVLKHFDGYNDFHQVMAASQQHEVMVLEVAFALLEADRLKVFEPAAPFRLEVVKAGFFKKGTQLEIAALHESRWRGLQPYSHGHIGQVRVQWRGGVTQDAVKFSSDLPEGVMKVPEAILQAWGIDPSESVVVRPAR